MQITIDEQMPPMPIEVYSDDSMNHEDEEPLFLNAYRIRLPSLDALDDDRIIDLVQTFISGSRETLHEKLLQLDPKFEFFDYAEVHKSKQ